MDLFRGYIVTKDKNISKTPIHRTWRNMKNRCYNKNAPDYKYYGGRGITVCEEWIHNSRAFYDWAINNGYKKGLTLDRIDVNGEYSPNNCRWVTMKEQCNNKRCCIKVDVNGVKKSLKELAKETGIKYTTLYMRYKSGKRGVNLYEK